MVVSHARGYEVCEIDIIITNTQASFAQVPRPPPGQLPMGRDSHEFDDMPDLSIGGKGMLESEVVEEL